MSRKTIDITGNTYNFLKVLEFSHIANRRRSYWKCECLLCGKIVILRKDYFAYPYSPNKSCGCWHKDKDRINKSKNKANGRFEKITNELI